MPAMKARIGITSFLDRSNSRGPYASVNNNYPRSVAMAGALPFIVPVSPEAGDATAFLDGIDGLLVTGGVDISPHLYGEDPVRGLGPIALARDDFEIALVREALRRRMPVFGICRGHQLVNVALGGSLYQDLGSQYPGALDHSPPEGQAMDEMRHSITILPAARRLRLAGESGKILVNSFHHQAVKKLAPGLVEVARAADGVNEAYEGEGEGWLVSVQFHPEALTLRWPAFLSLFEAHIKAAEAFAKT